MGFPSRSNTEIATITRVVGKAMAAKSASQTLQPTVSFKNAHRFGLQPSPKLCGLVFFGWPVGEVLRPSPSVSGGEGATERT